MNRGTRCGWIRCAARCVVGIVSALGFFIALGSVGALEIGDITLGQAMLQALIGMSAWIGGMWVVGR